MFHNNSNFLIPWCRCIYFFFILKCRIIWVIIRINTIFRRWLFLIFIYWNDLWISLNDLHFCWYFYKFIFSIFRNNNHIFFAWCCCVYWSFVLKCCAIRVLFWINALRSIWLWFAWVCYYVLCLRLYYHYFCRNFCNWLTI